MTRPLCGFTLHWENPHEAVDLLNRLMIVLPDVMLEVMDIGSVSVIDTPGQATGVHIHLIPEYSNRISRRPLFGCVLALFTTCSSPKSRNNSSLDTLGLDIIGEIPYMTPKRNRRWIS